MKANPEISLMDLENLTPGSEWKDEDGDTGFVIAVANKAIPKEVRKHFPLEVVFTRNAVDVYSIKVEDFLSRMTFVRAPQETAGYVASLLSALSSFKQLGGVTETGEAPRVNISTELVEEAPAAELQYPVNVMFNGGVTPDTAVHINSSLVSFTEKPYDGTIELTYSVLDNSYTDLLKAAFLNVIHVDTEAGIYTGDSLDLVGVTPSFVRNGDSFLSLSTVTLAILSSDESETDAEATNEALAEATNEALDAALSAAGVPATTAG